MGKRKRSKSAIKSQKCDSGNVVEDEEIAKAPHVIVINRGAVGTKLRELIKDTRNIFEPYTATNLKVKPSNSLKDFLSIAGTFHVSHIISFSRTENSHNVRIFRTPHGPTLSFKILSTCLAKEVAQFIKKPMKTKSIYSHHPLLILSGFKDSIMHHKIMSSMFQNMIPSIDVLKINLNQVKRCLLIKYDAENECIYLRHYSLKVNPYGINKNLKKIIKGKKVPNMSDYNDIHDYFIKEQASESEGELDAPDTHLTLPQNISGKGNLKSHQSAIRLIEIGPRLDLKLVKIEEGLCEGKVLFHQYITKTTDEIKQLNELHAQKKKNKLTNQILKQEKQIKKRRLKPSNKRLRPNIKSAE